MWIRRSPPNVCVVPKCGVLRFGAIEEQHRIDLKLN